MNKKEGEEEREEEVCPVCKRRKGDLNCTNWNRHLQKCLKVVNDAKENKKEDQKTKAKKRERMQGKLVLLVHPPCSTNSSYVKLPNKQIPCLCVHQR